jgi:hypothetical protein
MTTEGDEDEGATQDGEKAVVYGRVVDDLVFHAIIDAVCALTTDGGVAKSYGDG